MVVKTVVNPTVCVVTFLGADVSTPDQTVRSASNIMAITATGFGCMPFEQKDFFQED
jgi:hypothetical protein